MKRFISRFFTIIFFLIVVYSIISIRPYRVSGDSMEPVLRRESIVLIDRVSQHFSPLQRGEIIVYSDISANEKVKIKRLIGLPGEKIKIMDGKVLMKTGELEERYLGEHARTCLPGSCIDLSPYEYSVPDESYFVLGDNRENSVDSRGCSDATLCDRTKTHYVPQKEIIGRVIFPF